MRALIALDKFKDALSAQDACETVGDALRASVPDCAVDLCPLTDGGEGFVDVLSDAMKGERITVRATGPRGEPVDANIGLVNISSIPATARKLLDLPAEHSTDSPFARLAVIEMASVSGLALLPPHRRDPWQASSIGTGQLIRAARDEYRYQAAIDEDLGTDVSPAGSKDQGGHLHGRDARATSHGGPLAGVNAILLGIGGSATNDLGLGALVALGLQLLDTNGNIVSPAVPAEWARVSHIAGSIGTMPPIRIACDVTNPLTGPNGATAVYGPQKGLCVEDVPRMENEVRRLASLLTAYCQPARDCETMPGAGAAGGIAFGLSTCLGARLVNGFDLLCAWCDLEARMRAADIVITGEGRFDATSLQGKGPGAVALRAQQLGKDVHVFAGRIVVPAVPGITLHEITPTGVPLAVALQRARENLASSVRAAFAR